MTESNTADNSVCAIIVTYFPAIDFCEKIQVLIPQATRIVVIDNTPRESRKLNIKSALQAFTSIHIVENGNNLGQAAALNQGLTHAAKLGCKWILTLDQDTECYPEMVDTLLNVAEIYKPRPMLIGSNYLDLRSNRTKAAIGNANDFLEQKTVITSGSLIDARLAISIGGFRADYFIDQVDHEFCLRARKEGHKVVICRKVVMNHSVGNAGGVQLPFLGVMPNHSPLRKYYIARNSIVTIMSYWRNDPGWCLRRMVRLLLGLGFMGVMEKQRLQKIYAFMFGIFDGLRKRMGPCQRMQLQTTSSPFEQPDQN